MCLWVQWALPHCRTHTCLLLPVWDLPGQLPEGTQGYKVGLTYTHIHTGLSGVKDVKFDLICCVMDQDSKNYWKCGNGVYVFDIHSSTHPLHKQTQTCIYAFFTFHITFLLFTPWHCWKLCLWFHCLSHWLTSVHLFWSAKYCKINCQFITIKSWKASHV